MFHYPKYLVKENDQFDPENFSFVMDDMQMIREQTGHVPGTSKADILISFLKDHSLQNEWLVSNPLLTGMLTAGSLSTRNIESLFDSCRDKPFFRKQMEEYLRQGFSE